jgi:Oligosaccharyltransferase subunit Ribophorin II
VFFSLKRKIAGSIQVNSYGKLNKDSGLYEVTFDISKDFAEHFNGEYEMTITAADYRAEKPLSWTLGNIKIWYKEGLEEGSNSGIKAEYKPFPTIIFTYPPEQPQISLLLPLVGCGLLVFAFLRYFGHLFTAGRANLSRLSFWGLLFVANLLVILLIFTAFFIEVKLIPILWLLLFISPVSFFIANRALTQADCVIGEFR